MYQRFPNICIHVKLQMSMPFVPDVMHRRVPLLQMLQQQRAKQSR